jgi:hypothetical protein
MLAACCLIAQQSSCISPLHPPSPQHATGADNDAAYTTVCLMMHGHIEYGLQLKFQRLAWTGYEVGAFVVACGMWHGAHVSHVSCPSSALCPLCSVLSAPALCSLQPFIYIHARLPYFSTIHSLPRPLASSPPPQLTAPTAPCATARLRAATLRHCYTRTHTLLRARILALARIAHSAPTTLHLLQLYHLHIRYIRR